MTYSAAYSPTTERERARAHQAREHARAAAPPTWQPQAGPQQRAYVSRADVLGYGGEAGGGKSDLALGLAGTAHWRTLIFRREFPRLGGLIDRSREIFNADGHTAGDDSYNEALHRWKLRDGRQIQFAAIQYEQNKFNFQGRPHDLYVFDEATEFSETQIRFVIGWNRSTHIDTKTQQPQRCRVVLTFNPPMTTEGEWVVQYFLPWLAYLHPETYTHPEPAKPGELRWYATVDGVDTAIPEARLGWYIKQGAEHRPVASGDPFQEDGAWLVPVRGYEDSDGKLVLAKSRTFIPASLKDNPILEATGYAATVDAMPEPYRSLLKGGWGAGKIEDPWQLIPSAWVRAAEARHAARPTPTTPLSAVGADIARGGKDRMSIAKFYDTWLAPIETHPGVSVTNGPKGAALLLPYAGVPLGVDVISIGSSVYDSLQANDVPVAGINFGAGAPEFLRTRNGNLKFKNIRAAAYWKLREALDPAHGDGLALPDDPELREELCAPRFEVTAQGIQIEPKDAIKQRLGRSPDKADAVALAYYTLIAQPPDSGPPATSHSVRTW